MKTIMVILMGLVLSVIVLFVFASTVERGDTNAISMYFVAFLIPVLILALLNGLYIAIISRLTNKMTKLSLCFAPIVVLWLLTLFENLTIKGIDGNLTFVTKVGAISLGLTNILWLVSMSKTKVT
jgi:hypothetical protein